jgi:UDP-glucose 4-epimerase
MKALVLGGCGFIGSHVVDALLADRHEVRVFDLRPERYRPPCPGVQYIFGNFSESALIAEALSGVDTVFHLISTTFPGTANINPIADVEDNLCNTLRLILAMTESGVERIVFLSSGGTVYGVPERLPIPEDHPLRPINSYGIVKVAIESYFEMYHRQGKLRPIIIRAANPYGPRQSHIGVQGVVATFMQKVCDGKPIEIWGDGSVIRDYFHVEDLAALCVIAAKSDKVGTLNAGSGRGISLNELIDAIGAATGIDVRRISKPGRLIDVSETFLDISKARADFGWKPKIELREGLETYWSWLRLLVP